VADDDNRRVTILLGRGIGEGETFVVVGEARTMGEARRLTRTREFVARHLCPMSGGAYVLLVPGGGHQIFLPLDALADGGVED
jgi:hypothetical protein